MRFLSVLGVLVALGFLVGGCTVHTSQPTLDGLRSSEIARDMARDSYGYSDRRGCYVDGAHWGYRSSKCRGSTGGYHRPYKKPTYLETLRKYGYDSRKPVLCYQWYAYVHTPGAPFARADVETLVLQTRSDVYHRGGRYRGELRMMPHPYRERCRDGDVWVSTNTPVPDGYRVFLFEYFVESEIGRDARDRFNRRHGDDPTYNGHRRRLN